jgi:hypothetical protein
MSRAAVPTSQRPDYFTAMYADGPRLARYLAPLVPDSATWDNVKRQLRAMREEGRCVRFVTADKLCVRLGIHPSLLPDTVWMTWRAMHPARAS